jgi:hypothetical protein
MTEPDQPDPVIGATYVDAAHREHTVVHFARPRHVGGVPLVTILEGGRRDVLTLAQWKAKRAGMVLS